MKKKYFSLTDIILWAVSVTVTVAVFFLFDRENPLRLIATPIGVTSLILNSKGNPAGQLLIIIFSVLYGIISYSQEFYGEMATYLGMTAPMALAALISWLRNPYKGDRSQVKVGQVKGREWAFAIALTGAVTFAFYFILKALGTVSLAASTLSVATSFLAVYLTFKRSIFFSLAYAANDLVLIALWLGPSLSDPSYLSVIACFTVFFVNDVYCFFGWLRMRRAQRE